MSSVDYDNRARVFHANIEAAFGEVSSNLKIDVEKVLEASVEAYKKDLQNIDSKTRILDDVIAICKIGSDDAGNERKYEKIVTLLQAKGILPT